MFKRGVVLLLTLAGCLGLLLAAGCSQEPETIKIGFNVELTGDIPKVGESAKFTAEMIREEINAQGGLEVGGKKYPLEFIYLDNESKPESAVNATLKLVEQDGVMAMIGPNSSKCAVPAGGVCNERQTPMISPWSTNVDTTKGRPWVFRAAFLDSFQAPVAANFAAKQFNAKTTAVLFDISNDFSKAMADTFKQVWEAKMGPGTVLAFESHGAKEQDFSAQLTKIIATKPDFFFLPDLYNHVALVVKQARHLGYAGPFMGPDSWASAELMALCGKDCVGQFFSTHYAAIGAQGATKDFIDRYKAKYGYVPDDVAALNWDATHIMLQAIQNVGKIDPDLSAQRKAVRDALAGVKQFDGITGKMRFDAEGDPIKCAVVVRIDDDGQFIFTESVCPE